jgi:hypothetical protein
MARKKNLEPVQQKSNDNIIVPDNTNILLQIVNESTTIIDANTNTEMNIVNKSKRGRKSKKELMLLNNSNNILQMEEMNNENNIIITNVAESDKIENDNKDNDVVKTVAKKRGRKPKGGKIIQQITPIVNSKETKSNVILHLKCHLKDLNNNILSNNINGYDFVSNKNELYEVISNNDNIFSNIKPMNNNDDINVSNINYKNIQSDDEYTNSNSTDDDNNYKSSKNNDIKDLWKKLKHLQHNLHINNVNDKKSACFWCTYEFDNPSIYIPKHFIKDTYHVYGCFCSPECATAYLMEENIDSSTKFERYHLLNNIYSKIYDYKKNIKPAPKPFYVLEKFYGNLNIQEYRSLLKNERLFLVVDKPLTRILPELHEDNDDFIINNKIISSNTYQIKRKLLQKQTKNNILSEKFGLQQNS